MFRVRLWCPSSVLAEVTQLLTAVGAKSTAGPVDDLKTRPIEWSLICLERDLDSKVGFDCRFSNVTAGEFFVNTTQITKFPLPWI